MNIRKINMPTLFVTAVAASLFGSLITPTPSTAAPLAERNVVATTVEQTVISAANITETVSKPNRGYYECQAFYSDNMHAKGTSTKAVGIRTYGFKARRFQVMIGYYYGKQKKYTFREANYSSPRQAGTVSFKIKYDVFLAYVTAYHTNGNPQYCGSSRG